MLKAMMHITRGSGGSTKSASAVEAPSLLQREIAVKYLRGFVEAHKVHGESCEMAEEVAAARLLVSTLGGGE